MVLLLTPGPIWYQLANAFFTFSGLFGDLLVIRFFLFLAYFCTFLTAALGSPRWPDVKQTDSLALDSLLWSILGLYLHGSSLILLLWDERKVQMENEELESLWRMLYRTGGISRNLFQRVVARHVKVVEFEAGQVIPTDDFFYILYTGRVCLKVLDPQGENKHQRLVGSGGMFHLGHLGMFHHESIFVRNDIRVTSEIPTKLFQFSSNDMKCIANHRLAKGVWQALLIYHLSCVAEAWMDTERNTQRVIATCRSKVFDPLESWEEPVKDHPGSGAALEAPILHLWRCMQRSMSAPWPLGVHPSGLRQTQLRPPPSMPSNGDPTLGPKFLKLQSPSLHHAETVLTERGEEADVEENDLELPVGAPS